MSQSATIYRVSGSYFASLNKAEGGAVFDPDAATDSATFNGTHCGLEFLLCKITPQFTHLHRTIFAPENEVAPRNPQLDEEAWLETLDDGQIIPCLPPDKVSLIFSAIESITEPILVDNYAPDEMNREGIYPSVWSMGLEESVAYNERHIIADFMQLKALFSGAFEKNEYLLVFVG